MKQPFDNMPYILVHQHMLLHETSPHMKPSFFPRYGRVIALAFKSPEQGPSWKSAWWPEKSELLTHQLQFYFWPISIPETTFMKASVVGGRSLSGGLGLDGVQHRTILIIDCNIMYVRMPSLNYSSLLSGIPDSWRRLCRILLHQRDLKIYWGLTWLLLQIHNKIR